MNRLRTTLEQWEVLSAIVDHGSYARAAGAMNRSQTAISYALARLQESLDLKLLKVDGRKAVLTADGETLLRRARPLLRAADTLERLAQSLKQGWEPRLTLVVEAAFPRVHLLKIVAELQQLCPNTELELGDAVLSGSEQAILEGRADVVVTTRVPPGFLGEFLTEISFVAVARPDHALFRLEHPLVAADLSGHVQAVVRDSGTREPRDDGWLGAERRYTVSSLEASLATVEAGLTFAWLPTHLISESMQNARLRPLPLALGATRRVPLYLVLVRPELAGPAARAAIECFQRHLPSGARALPDQSRTES